MKDDTGDKYILESKNKKNDIINSIELLKKPLKIYDEDNPDEEIIDIVNPQQLEDIKKKYINYQFFCESTGISQNFSELILGQIIKHNLCNKKHFIRKIININMDENNFKSFFDKKEQDTDFNSIYDFKSHYDDYFTEKNLLMIKTNINLNFMV